MTAWSTITPERQDLYRRLLTPRQLETVRLRLNGHSWRTIATALNIDEATVRGHHRRALDRIKRAKENA